MECVGDTMMMMLRKVMQVCADDGMQLSAFRDNLRVDDGQNIEGYALSNLCTQNHLPSNIALEE